MDLPYFFTTCSDWAEQDQELSEAHVLVYVALVHWYKSEITDTHWKLADCNLT